MVQSGFFSGGQFASKSLAERAVGHAPRSAVERRAREASRHSAGGKIHCALPFTRASRSLSRKPQPRLRPGNVRRGKIPSVANLSIIRKLTLKRCAASARRTRRGVFFEGGESPFLSRPSKRVLESGVRVASDFKAAFTISNVCAFMRVTYRMDAHKIQTITRL